VGPEKKRPHSSEKIRLEQEKEAGLDARQGRSSSLRKRAKEERKGEERKGEEKNRGRGGSRSAKDRHQNENWKKK